MRNKIATHDSYVKGEWTDELGGRFAFEAEITLPGDKSAASVLIGKGRALMGELLGYMSRGELTYFDRTVNVNERFEQARIVGKEFISDERGSLTKTNYQIGVDAVIKLNVIGSGEHPILKILIIATPIYESHIGDIKFFRGRFSAALIGTNDELTNRPDWTLYNGYPEEHPLHDPEVLFLWLPAYPEDGGPGELIYSIAKTPTNKDQYIIFLDIIMSPPRGQSTECLLAGAVTTAWFNSEFDVEEELYYSETIGRRTRFDYFLFIDEDQEVLEHGKLVVEATDEPEHFDEYGWGEFVNYSESFTSYGGTTCIFNYYPELKESYGQLGDVGMFVADRLEDEAVDFSMGTGF